MKQNELEVAIIKAMHNTKIDHTYAISRLLLFHCSTYMCLSLYSYHTIAIALEYIFKLDINLPTLFLLLKNSSGYSRHSLFPYTFLEC